MANRVISMNRDHARGVRFPSTVRDEIDAAVAAVVAHDRAVWHSTNDQSAGAVFFEFT